MIKKLIDHKNLNGKHKNKTVTHKKKNKKTGYELGRNVKEYHTVLRVTVY